MSCGVGRRHSSDPTLPAMITPIRPLAWEPPYAMGAALGKAKKTKKKLNFNYIKLCSCISILFRDF